MKSKFIIILCFISVVLSAQSTDSTNTIKISKPLFLRIYDLHGHKIAKGKITAMSDNSLTIRDKIGNDTLQTINISAIGYIRTKHSVGHNILLGSVVAVGTSAIIGVTAEPTEGSMINFTPAEQGVIAGIVLLPVCAAIGVISGVAKNPRKFKINGDIEKWKVFESYIVKKNNSYVPPIAVPDDEDISLQR